MLRLTDIVGHVLRTAEGRVVGTVDDLVVRNDAVAPTVTRVLVATAQELTMSMAAGGVRSFDADAVIVDNGAVLLPLGESATIVADDELLLGRDVLDTRVVDVPDHFLVRAADVLIEWDGDVMTAIGIELTSTARADQAGLQRPAGRRTRRVIPWTDLHLTSFQGRAAQLATSTPLLDLGPTELARVLSKLSTAHVGQVLDHLSPDRSAATLCAAPPDQLRRLLDALPAGQVDLVLASLPPSRAASFRRALAELATRRVSSVPRRAGGGRGPRRRPPPQAGVPPARP